MKAPHGVRGRAAELDRAKRLTLSPEFGQVGVDQLEALAPRQVSAQRGVDNFEPWVGNNPAGERGNAGKEVVPATRVGNEHEVPPGLAL